MRIRGKFLSALGAMALLTGGVVSMTPAVAQFGGLGLGDIGRGDRLQVHASQGHGQQFAYIRLVVDNQYRRFVH